MRSLADSDTSRTRRWHGSIDGQGPGGLQATIQALQGHRRAWSADAHRPGRAADLPGPILGQGLGGRAPVAAAAAVWRWTGADEAGRGAGRGGADPWPGLPGHRLAGTAGGREAPCHRPGPDGDRGALPRRRDDAGRGTQGVRGAQAPRQGRAGTQSTHEGRLPGDGGGAADHVQGAPGRRGAAVPAGAAASGGGHGRGDPPAVRARFDAFAAPGGLRDAGLACGAALARGAGARQSAGAGHAGTGPDRAAAATGPAGTDPAGASSGPGGRPRWRHGHAPRPMG
jgi:hypothetical protein